MTGIDLGPAKAPESEWEAFKKVQRPTMSLAAALALFHRQAMGANLYAGTVTDKEKARRRAKNKVAKRSRKVNRSK